MLFCLPLTVEPEALQLIMVCNNGACGASLIHCT